MHFYRFILISLAETGFAAVPEHVARCLTEMFEGFASTKVAENFFRVLRGLEKGNSNGSLSRESRWLGALGSDLLAEQGRSTVEPSSETTLPSTALPQATFAAEGGKASLPDDVFRSLTDGPASWASPSPANYNKVPLMWEALLQASPTFVLLETAWLSLLLQPHCVIHNPAGRGGLFLHTTPYGALVLDIKLLKLGGVHVYRSVEPGGSIEWHQLTLQSLEGWRAVDCKAMSPQTLRLEQAKRQQNSGWFRVALRRSSDPEGLLAFAARKGFPNMTCIHLKKLIQYLKVTSGGRVPSTEIDMVRILVQHALPGTTEAAMQEILRRRGCKEKPEPEHVLSNPANVELVECMLDDDDMEVAKGRCKKGHC